MCCCCCYCCFPVAAPVVITVVATTVYIVYVVFIRVVCVNLLTFRTQAVCLHVEDASQQRHLLEDDSEAVNVSFLRPAGWGAVRPLQLRRRPQLPCNTPATPRHHTQLP